MILKLSRSRAIENEMKERAARGEPIAMLMENRNALTRCIGQPPPLEAECTSHTLLPHDRYLLCSDGISRFISPGEITEILASATEPEAAARQLIARANELGGLDNSTAVVLFCD